MVLVLVRMALLAGAAAATAGAVSAATGAPFSLASASQLSALYFVPVNVVCLALLARGGRITRLLGERPWLRRSDVGYGLLWLFVAFVPFAVVLNAVVLLTAGASGYAGAWERLFAPPAGAELAMSRGVSLALAAVTVILFPVTNAPVEELLYRGHGLAETKGRGVPPRAAIAQQAALFGVQHVFLAPTPAAMAAYVMAFTAWGATAGVIYQRQGRLMPLIVAHLLTNLMTSAVPLVLLLAGTAT